MPPVVKCPICQAEVSWEGNPYRPFCSERCRLIDLGAWTEGRYRIPGQALEQESKRESVDDEEKPS
ncbi:MAG: DNA gyrase inhibitor YacG [Deltaproteobacteria bacterium]|nr:DNA gyrase inhibitor YacG [Deltaproteobacteria bacterium]